MAAQTQKRCLYEILQLPRDCTPEQIRSSYRRLALQLHPDKNPNSSPDAFQALQNAYEILSDPKERAFYDSHRSQILFSSPSSSSKSSSLFDVEDLVPYFSNSAFSGYGTTGKGFYKVYADVFDKVYSQELLFVKEMGLSRDLVRDAPLFGNLESEYEQWSAFYGYWLGFVTVLDFGWVDEYDASLGVNRKSRRLMEEENKKKRKKAKREYIDLVRDLAAFVKKRDKRVIDMQVKKALEEEKRKEEERKRKKEEMMRKIERAKMYEEPDWVKAEEIVDEDDEVDMGKKREEFYCIACNKKFKSDKQWKNHEQSKKHKEKVAELRVSFQKEEELVKAEESEEEDVYFEPENNENAVNELCEELNKDLDLKDEKIETEDFDDAEEGMNSNDEASVLEAMVAGRNNKQNLFANLDDFEDILEQGCFYDNEKEIHASHDSKKNRDRQRRRGDDFDGINEYIKEDTSSTLKSGDEAHSQEELKGESIIVDIPSAKDVEREVKETPFTNIDGTFAKGKGSVGAGKKSKKQQTDAKGSIKKDTKTSKSKGKKQKGNAKSSSNACDTCGENFETRNKLFAHLGNTGHASLKSR